jgi:hypothetical protein
MDIAAIICMKRLRAQMIGNARMMIETTIIHVGKRLCDADVMEVLSSSMRDDSAVGTPLLAHDSYEPTLPDLKHRVDDVCDVDELIVNSFAVDLDRSLFDHSATFGS